MFLLIALLVSLIGILPLLLCRRFGAAGILGAVFTVVLSLIYYGETPSTVYPLFGAYGVSVLIMWVISAFISVGLGSDDGGSAAVPIVCALIGICLYIIVGICSSHFVRTEDYARMIGKVEEKQWTQDIQPKDPHHVRLVPLELAYYLATKQLGNTHPGIGILGSQYQIEMDQMTLQMVKGELWYVAPLDFKNYSSWSTTGRSPGYVMVSAEDPKRPVVLKTDEKLVYTPNACFGHNLERHLWYSYYSKGLQDYSFEIDEEGKPWWVVSVFETTIGWDGEKVLGVAIVDPTSGDQTFYAVKDVPTWVDRVYPDEFVEHYVDWNGEYSGGWWNSVWGHKDITEGETPFISYGSDGQPYWVLDITSNNARDTSMVGLVYVNSRTGAVTKYRAAGSTSSGVIAHVNGKVSYRKLHGSSPVLYNMAGIMTAVVPLLTENHSFQGVALVDVANMVSTDAEDIQTAYRKYEQMVTSSGQGLAPEVAHETNYVAGVVDRFVAESRNGDTFYFFHVDGRPKIFTATGDVSPKLRLTKVGDSITCSFIDTGEDTLQLLQFGNSSLKIESSKLQVELRNQVLSRTTPQ